MEIAEILRTTRHALETQIPKPYYNAQGFRQKDFAIGEIGHNPRHNPFDLPEEQEDWREHADY